MKFNLCLSIIVVSFASLNCISPIESQLKVGKNSGETPSFTDNVQLVLNYPDVKIAKEYITELVVQCYKDGKMFYQFNKTRTVGAIDFVVTDKFIPSSGIDGIDQRINNQQIWLNLQNWGLPWQIAGKYLCNGTVSEIESSTQHVNTNKWNTNTVDLKYVPNPVPVDIPDDPNFHLKIGNNSSFSGGENVNIYLAFPRETTKASFVSTFVANCFKDEVKFYEYRDRETKFIPISGVNEVDQEINGQVHLTIRSSISNKNTAGLYMCNGTVTEVFDDGDSEGTRDWTSEKVELKFLH